MATINLGSIKFNWKGAYNGATAYAVDDVVSSGGSSYVCILASTGNAVSNGTYWEIMAQTGTNGTDGTDLTSTLSTRGDIVFKGASALTRLPKGTAGYYLKQGANDPEWSAVSGGGVLQAIHNHNSTPVNTSSSSYVATNNSVTITPTASNSKIYVVMNGSVTVNNPNNDPWIFVKVQRSIGGGAYGDVISNWYRRYAPSAGAAIHILEDVNFNFIDAPATTSAVIYKVYYHGGGDSVWFGGRSSSEPSSTNGIAIELANGIA